MTRIPVLLLSLGILGFGGCSGTMTPDYTIKVVPAADGQSLVAVPPECPSWSDETISDFANKPLPQFGCANARNLAIMIDRPDDLLKGRDSTPASGVTSAGAMERYNTGKTAPLLDPSADSAASGASSK